MLFRPLSWRKIKFLVVSKSIFRTRWNFCLSDGWSLTIRRNLRFIRIFCCRLDMACDPALLDGLPSKIFWFYCWGWVDFDTFLNSLWWQQENFQLVRSYKIEWRGTTEPLDLKTKLINQPSSKITLKFEKRKVWFLGILVRIYLLRYLQIAISIFFKISKSFLLVVCVINEWPVGKAFSSEMWASGSR